MRWQKDGVWAVPPRRAGRRRWIICSSFQRGRKQVTNFARTRTNAQRQATRIRRHGGTQLDSIEIISPSGIIWKGVLSKKIRL